MMSLGKRLKYLRKKKGWTQQEVADRLSILRVTYTYYENDKRTPDLNVLVKLCNLFSVCSDFILGLTNDPNPYASEENLHTIISLSEKLSFDDKEIESRDRKIILKTIKHALEIMETMEDDEDCGEDNE